MTELKTFLVALYDALSEAETEAFVHGRERYLELAEREQVPRDISVPVYHAADLNVSLDVGVVAEETESGTEIRITDSTEDDSTLSFNAEVFDLIEEGDIQTIDYADLVSEYPGEFPAVPDIDGSTLDETEDTPESVEDDEEQQPEEEQDEEQQEEKREEEQDEQEGQQEGEGGPGGGEEVIDRPGMDVLGGSGMETVAEILGRTQEELQEIVDEEVSDSMEGIDSWIREAATEAEETLDQSVEVVDGIGPAYRERLADAGVETLLDLVQRQPDEVAAAVSTDTHAVSAERAAQWIEQGRRQIRAIEGSADDTLDGDTER